MSDYDWSKFDIFFYIEDSPDNIFDKWATAEGLESFFMKNVHYESASGQLRTKNSYAESGDKYKWEFVHGSVIEGFIKEVEQDHKISFSFGDESIVDVLFIRSDKRTLVHLCQYNIPLSAEGQVHIHLNCRGAWIHFLTVLKSVLEFGIDCRDKNPLTGGSLATGFIPAEIES